MKLSQPIIDKLVSRMYPPTGVWRDFAHDVRMYKCLQAFVKQGRLETSDLPPEPQPSDYADTEAEPTRPQ